MVIQECPFRIVIPSLATISIIYASRNHHQEPGKKVKSWPSLTRTGQDTLSHYSNSYNTLFKPFPAHHSSCDAREKQPARPVAANA